MAFRAYLASLSLLSVATLASAQSASVPVRLELSGPPGCSSARELLDALQRRNGRVRLASSDEAAVTLKILLRPSDRGLRGDLSVWLDDGSSTERSVEGATCQAVVEALSLTAALALASVAPPDTTSSAGQPASGSAASGPSTANGAATTPSGAPSGAGSTGSSSGRQSSRGRMAFEAGAQASLSQMVAPHLNVGGGLLGRARLERSSWVSPSLTLSLTHTRNELFESSKHAELRVTGVSLSACPVALRPHPRFRFEPCVSATAAELSATGRDLWMPRSVSRSWWGLGALARLSVLPVRDFSVELEGGGLVPLVSRRYVVSPTEQELGATPSVAPFASVGLVYAL